MGCGIMLGNRPISASADNLAIFDNHGTDWNFTIRRRRAGEVQRGFHETASLIEWHDSAFIWLY